MKKILGISWLGWVNRVFFQWWCIRLTKHQEKIVSKLNIQSYDMVLGGISSRGTGKVDTYQWYSIQYWVVPLTGWGTDYKYLKGDPKYFKITKKKIIE